MENNINTYCTTEIFGQLVRLDISGTRRESLINAINQTMEKVHPIKRNKNGQPTYIPAEREPYKDIIESVSKSLPDENGIVYNDMFGGFLCITEFSLKRLMDTNPDLKEMYEEIQYAKAHAIPESINNM